jgi:hypothetical protein
LVVFLLERKFVTARAMIDLGVAVIREFFGQDFPKAICGGNVTVHNE